MVNLTKGQSISKANFPAKNSSKKRTNQFVFLSWLLIRIEKQIRWFRFWKKFWLENLFSIFTDLYYGTSSKIVLRSFFGRIEDTKKTFWKHFEINWLLILCSCVFTSYFSNSNAMNCKIILLNIHGVNTRIVI